MPSILLIEDDRELAAMLERVLVRDGWEVASAQDGQRGLHLALTRTYDAIVLDRGLPVVDGLEVLVALRGRGVITPLLILSARGTVDDRIAGLDRGAEDYVVKPFDVGELLARLRSLVRRSATEPRVLPVGSRFLDLDGYTVRAGRDLWDDEVVDLTEREAQLLGALAARPTRVFSRDELLERVFNRAETGNVVDTYVSQLRRKLGREVIATVHGVGYRLGRS